MGLWLEATFTCFLIERFFRFSTPIAPTPIPPLPPLPFHIMDLSKSEPEKHSLMNGRGKDLELMDVRSDAGSSTSTTTLYDNMESDEKLRKIDVEKQGSPSVGKPKEVRTSRVQLLMWMIVNTVATIAIVSIDNPSMKTQNSTRKTKSRLD